MLVHNVCKFIKIITYLSLNHMKVFSSIYNLQMYNVSYDLDNFATEQQMYKKALKFILIYFFFNINMIYLSVHGHKVKYPS